MDLVRNVFSGGFGMGTGALSDTVKLVVIGGTVETARRMASSSWNSFLDSFFLTAHFTQTDSPYEWIMHWLSKQPAWGRSREFDITTHTVRKGNASAGDFGDEEEEDEDSSFAKSSKKNMIAFMPAQDTTHTIYYRGHWLRITRSKRSTDYGQCHEVKISVVARNNTVIKQLVLEAKKLYEKDAEHRIHVFIPDTWGNWRWNGSRQKRPLESVVLESSVKDMIVSDCKDFISSEEWYAERGIPYRRGYLLYGVPGSGKTSLIHALAGELGLDIYALSLSAKGMSDNTLTQLMGRIPVRCIVLLEDLDASFTHSTTRDKKSTGVPTASTTATTESDGNSLTLSGLLNAIDGVTAPEGRILFATTNHIDRLDEALRRPGRMDVWINFKHATQWQAEGIFKRFFPCKPKTTSGADTPLGSDISVTPSAATAAAFSSSVSDRVNKRSKSLPNSRILDEEELSILAKKFAEQIPENEVSVAGLQGFLLKNKARPRECVEEVAAWVIEERERREKLKKEKEEKERKEKEEEEKKEKEEKEKEEKEKEGVTPVDLVAARKAYRKAKKAAVLAAAATLPTPTAEDTPESVDKSSSSDDESSGSSGSEGEEASSTSSTDGGKKKKQSRRKEKWVAIKKSKDDSSAAVAETQETTEQEDTSSVDALVDAATKSTAVPADAPAEQSA